MAGEDAGEVALVAVAHHVGDHAHRVVGAREQEGRFLHLDGAHQFGKRDVEDLLRLAAEIPIQTDVELFPLEKANEVLLMMKRSGIRGAAVLVINPRPASTRGLI